MLWVLIACEYSGIDCGMGFYRRGATSAISLRTYCRPNAPARTIQGDVTADAIRESIRLLKRYRTSRRVQKLTQLKDMRPRPLQDDDRVRFVSVRSWVYVDECLNANAPDGGS